MKLYWSESFIYITPPVSEQLFDDFNITDEILSAMKYVFSLYLP